MKSDNEILATITAYESAKEILWKEGFVKDAFELEGAIKALKEVLK